MQPPMHLPMQPTMCHPMQPPMLPPMQPPRYNPPMQDHNYPGRKRIFPKRPVAQINIGMKEPQPDRYYIPHMIPHVPKHLFVPGRGKIYNNRMKYNPVREIIDFVADPIGFMVEKSLGLKSKKPETEKKE